MSSLTTIIDPTTGDLTIEGWTSEQAAMIADLLPDPVEVNCAMPATGIVEDLKPRPGATMMRLARVYHSSVVDGPGIRSVIQMQGCPIKCVGCYVPWTHDAAAGIETSTASAIDAAIMNSGPRDGVTLLGGEPFAQPEALADLVRLLKMLGEHVLVYSGFTLANLKRRRNEHIDYVLSAIDMLIDGPYVAKLADDAGEWKGSRNQTVRTRAELDATL